MDVSLESFEVFIWFPFVASSGRDFITWENLTDGIGLEIDFLKLGLAAVAPTKENASQRF
jgi:hypothetical protein